MYDLNMFSKTIGLHKTAFDNTLMIFYTMQQHGEDLLKTTLGQSPWLPKSSKNACLYLSDVYSEYLENLRSVADQSYAEIERISSPGSKPVAKPAKNELQPKVTTEQAPTPRPAKKSSAASKKTVSTKKTVVANTVPPKESVTQDASIKKPITQSAPTPKQATTQKAPTEKLLTHERPEETKTAISKPEPSVTKQSITDSPSEKKK